MFAAPTATLDELEYHTTTLKPGASPHAPHTHKNEELLIIKAGEVEAYVNGEWKPAPTGSLVFFASMVPHTVRNPGTVPATYHVVNWAALGTKAAQRRRSDPPVVAAGMVRHCAAGPSRVAGLDSPALPSPATHGRPLRSRRPRRDRPHR